MTKHKYLLHQKQKIVRLAFLFLLGLHLLIIIVFWLYSSKFYLVSGDFSLKLIAIGRLLGLLGVSFALAQFILISRIKVLEQTYGQDAMVRLHRKTGYLTFVTILLHPIFIIIGNALLGSVNIFSQYITFLNDYQEIGKATLAFLGLIAVTVSSAYVVRKKLKYEWWYLVHLLTYMVVVLAYAHQLQLGTTVNITKASRIYWIFMYSVVLLVFVFNRALKPLRNYFLHKFVVESVVQESKNIVSIYITGNKLNKFSWRPGQFGIFTFMAPGLRFEAHPFSFSYLKDDTRTIRITVKAVGDFTTKLQQVPIGSKVMIQGPYGILGRQIERENEVLLIAGGIGISSIRTLFERFTRSGRDVVLVYSAHEAGDLVLKSEIDALAALFSNAKVFYLARTDGITRSDIQNGRFSVEYLVSRVFNVPGRQCFISGPPAMASAAKAALIRIGVPGKKIYIERFSYRS